MPVAKIFVAALNTTYPKEKDIALVKLQYPLTFSGEWWYLETEPLRSGNALTKWSWAHHFSSQDLSYPFVSSKYYQPNITDVMRLPQAVRASEICFLHVEYLK